MPSVIHMLSLAVIAAITAGTVAVYYAFNSNEPLHENVNDQDVRRRRRRNDAPQREIQRRLDQLNNPDERSHLALLF